jgi:hypothetical protein
MDGALPVLQMAILPIPFDEESLVARSSVRIEDDAPIPARTEPHATRSLLNSCNS